LELLSIRPETAQKDYPKTLLRSSKGRPEAIHDLRTITETRAAQRIKSQGEEKKVTNSAKEKKVEIEIIDRRRRNGPGRRQETKTGRKRLLVRAELLEEGKANAKKNTKS